jgi:hypothetical protein
MSKHVARNLTLALTLLALAPAALAASPTGGDPEPMGVGLVNLILTVLYLA